MQVLCASNYKRMPWKNGGGETVEIAIFPPNATVNDFDWRISMATVASDGPFSIFLQIDRTLSILEGNGMSLSIDGAAPLLLTTESKPLGFPADVPVNAALVKGAITDLNVMTRRGKFSHQVKRMSGDFLVENPAENETVFLLSKGNVSAEAGAQVINLKELDAVSISAETRIKAGGAICYLITMSAI